jgi:hypothetical protein
MVLISCKASHQKSDCNENMKFKEMFFHHVEYIENNIGAVQDAKFRQSVTFISNYAPVSVDSIMNYAMSYPIGIFQQDKIKWIEWYEENKCKNIQFKDTYIIPEVYQDYITPY